MGLLWLLAISIPRLAHLGLAEDLQQLVVGQEEEARKGQALRLQVVGQALLDRLQQLVGFDQLVQKLLT